MDDLAFMNNIIPVDYLNTGYIQWKLVYESDSYVPLIIIIIIITLILLDIKLLGRFTSLGI